MIETQICNKPGIDNDLSYKIIGAAMEVHKTLGGTGLLESVYESALCHELDYRDLNLKLKFQ